MKCLQSCFDTKLATVSIKTPLTGALETGATAARFAIVSAMSAASIFCVYAGELPPVEEDHRFADGQFRGYLTYRCQGR
jgi:hypothetical protein